MPPRSFAALKGTISAAAASSSSKFFSKLGERGEARHAIAVHSCKGGVGKSTIALNLAISLAKRGHRVALIDADVHGPSLPTLVGLPSTKAELTRCGYYAKPILAFDGLLKCMSVGFLLPLIRQFSNSPLSFSVRGPVASNLLRNMFFGVEWGQIDTLVIDLPPGTGDCPLEIFDFVRILSTVVVTTANQMSQVDVMRGVDLVEHRRSKITAVVENMTYFECDHGQKYYLWGRGGGESIMNYVKKNNPGAQLFELPLLPALTAANDTGHPLQLMNEKGNEKGKEEDNNNNNNNDINENEDVIDSKINISKGMETPLHVDSGVTRFVTQDSQRIERAKEQLESTMNQIAAKIENDIQQQEKQWEDEKVTKPPPLLKLSYEGAAELEHWHSLLTCARLVFYK